MDFGFLSLSGGEGLEHIGQGLHWVLGLGFAWLFFGMAVRGLGLGLGAMCEGSDVKDHA